MNLKNLPIHTVNSERAAHFLVDSLPSSHSYYGSVNSKCAYPLPRHLSGICHFVFEKQQMPHGGARRSYIKSTVGLKLGCKCPTPGQHQHLREISNDLIKTREVPFANPP